MLIIHSNNNVKMILLFIIITSILLLFYFCIVGQIDWTGECGFYFGLCVGVSMRMFLGMFGRRGGGWGWGWGGRW